MTSFEQMTPEQFEYWMTHVRPLLVAMQERSSAQARRWAMDMIGRPVHRERSERYGHEPDARAGNG